MTIMNKKASRAQMQNLKNALILPLTPPLVLIHKEQKCQSKT